ncbi:hypothetical protein NKDENANG_02280 [Candidatus Entotheonellaceae bacterium PAL068K]
MVHTGIPETIRRQVATQGAALYRAPEGGAYVVIRRAETWRVYANTCPHRRLPLDRAGRFFFTADGTLLVCANHGARFDPQSGQCVAGPCVGKSLRRIPTLES